MQNELTVSPKKSQQLICASELEQIQERYKKILTAARASLDEAIAIGGLLVKVKEKVGFGNWLDWVRDNLPFSLRRAEYWMGLFENRKDVKFANFANLSSAYRPLLGSVIDVESEIVTSEPSNPDLKRPPMSAADAWQIVNYTLDLFAQSNLPVTLEEIGELHSKLIAGGTWLSAELEAA
jgi:hypothetical protein